MTKEYLFSVCLYIGSDTNLERSIAGVIGKESFFKENMQLLLLDKLCSEYTIGLCEKYTSAYPENIFFVECRGESPARAYNNARPLAAGHYIAFVDNLGVYAPDTFTFLAKNIDRKNRIITLNPVTFSPSRGEEYYMPKYDEGIININDTPDRFHFMLGAYFFEKRLINGLYFDDTLVFHDDVRFILDALRMGESCFFVRRYNYTTAKSYEYDFNSYPPQYDRAFYTETIRKFILPYLQSHSDSAFVQSAIFYLIAIKFSLNMNDRCKCTLAGSEVSAFFQVCSEALAFISDPILLNPELYRRSRLEPEAAFRILRLKHHNKYLKPQIQYFTNSSYTYTGRDLRKKTIRVRNEWIASLSNALVGRSSESSVKITAINYDRGGLVVDGVLEGVSYFEPDGVELVATINKKRLSVHKTEIYSLTKFFGVTFLSLYTFRLYVPLSSGKTIDVLAFHIKIADKQCRVGLRFGNEGARLSTEVKNSYWVFADKLIYRDRKIMALVIRKATDSLVRRRESKFLSEVYHQVPFKTYWYYRRLRAAARKLQKSPDRETIWMFYDENGIDKNGNLLFRFVRKFKKSSGITPYFSLHSDSEAESFLAQKYGNTLEIGTDRQKLATMLSDIIVATDCDVYEALGFSRQDRIYLRDMFRASMVSLKNFFMTAKTAQFDNRLRDNTRMVLCCSPQEKKQLMLPVYGYSDSMIKITGYPVFDSFRTAPEKRLLIYPAEHHEFMMYENLTDTSLANTAFFKVYNSLITDITLLNFAQTMGFKITLLLPPSLERFVRCFSAPGVAEIVPFSSKAEHRLIATSSVLLTDFSEAQYLFAGLNRPVVYYLPPILAIPDAFHNMNLSEKGFGVVTFTQKDAVRQLCDCMRHENASLQLPFRLRRDTFFAYRDTQNCERAFNELKKLQKYLSALRNSSIDTLEKPPQPPKNSYMPKPQRSEPVIQQTRNAVPKPRTEFRPESAVGEIRITQKEPVNEAEEENADNLPKPKTVPNGKTVININDLDPALLQKPVRPQKNIKVEDAKAASQAETAPPADAKTNTPDTSPD